MGRSPWRPPEACLFLTYGGKGRITAPGYVNLAPDNTCGRRINRRGDGRHECPEIASDIVAVVHGRTGPAVPRARQVDELAGDAGTAAGHRHRDIGPGGIPGVGDRVVLPGLAILDKARV